MFVLVLIDFGNLFGFVKFYSGVCGKGVKLVVGVDVWIINLELLDDVYCLLLFVCMWVGY